jgi:hypothetical protein
MAYAERMLSPSQVSRSVFLLVGAIILVGVLVGHALTAAGIALFLFLLAAIEGKPSWRRIFDPDRRGEAGIFGKWKRLAAHPKDRDPMARS